MGRKAKELGPLAVSQLAAPDLHLDGGVAGLALQVNQRGARSWVLRVQVGDLVEAAYRRCDMFEKRRRLMKDWAAFCANPEIRKGSVISMSAARP